MGIKERIETLQEQMRILQKEDPSEETEKAPKESRREKRYNAELPSALRLRSNIYNELREIGILSLLEEMTGPIQLPPENLVKELIQTADSIGRQFSGKWAAYIPQPRMGHIGSPSASLEIEIKRVQVEAPRPNMSPDFKPPTLSVNIKCTLGQRLTIQGAKKTFDGKLSTGNEDIFTDAIAKAFLQPKVEWPEF